MRLQPEMNEQDIRSWLKARVEEDGPVEEPPEELEQALRSFAEAMAALNRIVLPDELEPLFP